MPLARGRRGLEGGDDALGPFPDLLRVDAHVERRHVQPEDLDPRAEVGESAVGDAGSAVGAKRRVDAREVAGELVRVAVLVRREPLPDPHELVAVGLVARRVELRPKLRNRADELRGHAPGGAELAHLLPQQVARQRPRALERIGDRLRAGVRVAVHVAADPRAEPEWGRGARNRVLQLANEPRQRLPQAPLDEPEAVANLVDDARPARAHLVRLPEHRHLLADAIADATLRGGRQLRIVQPAQRRCEPLMRLEDRAARRLGRVRGQHRPYLEPCGRLEQFLVADTGVAQARDRVGERLSRDPPLVLVLPPPPQPVVLLGDVGELEEERERPQHRRLLLELEPTDRRLELGAIAGLAGDARQTADLLLQRQQLVAFLLDEHLPEHVAEQADVGAELRVGSAHRRVTLRSFVPSLEERSC